MPAVRSVESSVASPITVGCATSATRWALMSTMTTECPASTRSSVTARPTRPQPHTIVCPRHLVDLPVHHAPPDEVSEFTFHHQLHGQRERVQHGRHAGDDQEDREPLLGVVEVLQLAETDRGDRGDGLVGGIGDAHAEQPVADRADDADGSHHADRPLQAPDRSVRHSSTVARPLPWGWGPDAIVQRPRSSSRMSGS